MQNRAMNPETIAAPLGAYSHAVEIPTCARVLHVSGQIGICPDGTIPEDSVSQAENAWSNLMRIIEHSGMTTQDIVKVNQFLTRERSRRVSRGARKISRWR